LRPAAPMAISSEDGKDLVEKLDEAPHALDIRMG
jgi:hypothetical protein